MSATLAMTTTAPAAGLNAAAVTNAIAGMGTELAVVAGAGLAIGAGILVVKRGWGFVKGLAK